MDGRLCTKFALRLTLLSSPTQLLDDDDADGCKESIWKLSVWGNITKSGSSSVCISSKVSTSSSVLITVSSEVILGFVTSPGESVNGRGDRRPRKYRNLDVLFYGILNQVM